MRKKISLQEALCGFNMNIKTLQKEARFVPITTAPGQVIQDKMLYRVPNEGKCFQNDLYRHSLRVPKCVQHFFKCSN